jgi:hypothetical protein
MFDVGLEDHCETVSTSTMVLELATVLLGACIGVVAVLYAAPKGYLGHARRKGSIDSMTSLESYTPTTEQAVVVPPLAAATVAEPAPPPVQAIYENVQVTPAPVQYAAPSTTSFGVPSISKKPTRTYRRRTAPVRSRAASKASLKTRTKKR